MCVGDGGTYYSSTPIPYCTRYLLVVCALYYRNRIKCQMKTGLSTVEITISTLDSCDFSDILFCLGSILNTVPFTHYHYLPTVPYIVHNTFMYISTTLNYLATHDMTYFTYPNEMRYLTFDSYFYFNM